MNAWTVVVVVVLLAYAIVVWRAGDAIGDEAVLLTTFIVAAGPCALLGVVQLWCYAAGARLDFNPLWTGAAALIGGALLIFGAEVFVRTRLDAAPTRPKESTRERRSTLNAPAVGSYEDDRWVNATPSDLAARTRSAHPRT